MESTELGKNIRENRERLGLSVIQVAEQLSLSRQTIYGWERGEFAPDDEALKALAGLFGTTAIALRFGPKDAYGDSEAFHAGVQEGLRRAREAVDGLLARVPLVGTVPDPFWGPVKKKDQKGKRKGKTG